MSCLHISGIGSLCWLETISLPVLPGQRALKRRFHTRLLNCEAMPPTGPEAKALFGGAAAKVELWAEAFAANIAKFQLIYLLLLSCLYFIVTSFHAAHKLFLVRRTYSPSISAREPSVSAFWEAVRNRTDLNPPFEFIW